MTKVMVKGMCALLSYMINRRGSNTMNGYLSLDVSKEYYNRVVERCP